MTAWDERLARAALCRIADPGDVKLAAAVGAQGAAQVVGDIERGSFKSSRLARLRSALGEADPHSDLEAAERVGARFVCPGDVEWPSQLEDLARLAAADTAVPFGLWVRGQEDLRLAALRSVAVVGARAATSYGEYVAAGLAADLTSRAWTVVSGGAFGIDGAAHRGALAGDGLTVAVLACGIDVPYPRAHTALLERIASRGLLVSESAPGTAPIRHRFLVRNRIIAALTRGTVVVEAALRSGARNTAKRAREMARHVMAVPGPVTSAMSMGCHELLRNGEAQCVTGAGEVIELVGAMGADLADEVEDAGDTFDDEGLDTTARAVLESIPAKGGIGLASLALHTGLAPHAASSALGMLFACGLVERADGGWRRVRARR